MGLPDRTHPDPVIQRLLDWLHRDRGVRGWVGGATGNIIAGTGFTAVRNGVGDYTITFTRPFPAAPIVILGTGGTAAAYYSKLHATTAPSTTAFRVATLLTATGAAADGDFTFQALLA